MEDKKIIEPPKVDPIITDFKALRKISKPTSWEEIKKLNLIDRLRASNETAWTPGIGLAAIQIGIPLRMGWFMDKENSKNIILVNPVITKAAKKVIVPKEGCLSIPGVWSQTERYCDVTVTTLGEKEPETLEFSGFLAIVVQHEVDHMNGVLNIQRRYHPPQLVGRNEPCPECLKKGITKKYKKCEEHFEKVYTPDKEPEAKKDSI